MFFEVVNKFGMTVMSTYQKSCIPDKGTCDMMLAAGYRFKLDGKLIPKGCNIISAVDAAISASKA